MAYEYLSTEEQAKIVAEYRAGLPDPVKVQRDAEEEHFRQTLQAKMRGDDYPVYDPPDVTPLETSVAVLVAEAAKLPAIGDVVLPVEDGIG